MNAAKLNWLNMHQNIRSQQLISQIIDLKIVYAAELNWIYLCEKVKFKHIHPGANITHISVGNTRYYKLNIYSSTQGKKKVQKTGSLLWTISKNLSSGQTFWITIHAIELWHIKSWGALNLTLSSPQRKQHLQIKTKFQNLISSSNMIYNSRLYNKLCVNLVISWIHTQEDTDIHVYWTINITTKVTQ